MRRGVGVLLTGAQGTGERGTSDLGDCLYGVSYYVLLGSAIGECVWIRSSSVSRLAFLELDGNLNSSIDHGVGRYGLVAI